ADGLQGAKAGHHVFHERRDGVRPQILDLQSFGDTAQIPEPASSLRQRYADMPASAFVRLAELAHHRAERHQIAGSMAEHLGWQFLRPVDAGRLPFGVIEAGRGLNQRIKAATLRPRTGMAVSRQRYIDDPRRNPCRILRREAERSNSARAVTLRENVG